MIFNSFFRLLRRLSLRHFLSLNFRGFISSSSSHLIPLLPRRLIFSFVLLLLIALACLGSTQTACHDCTKANSAWCSKEFGTTTTKFCLSPSLVEHGCLGGFPSTECHAIIDATDVQTCQACIDIGKKWCISGDGDAQVRACVPSDSDCKTPATIHATCETTKLVATPMVIADADCKNCLRTSDRSWCTKVYTAPKGLENTWTTRSAHYCVRTDSEARQCIGASVIRRGIAGHDLIDEQTLSAKCPGSPARVSDVTTCEDCIDRNGAWCIRGSGDSQIRVCIPPGASCGEQGDEVIYKCPLKSQATITRETATETHQTEDTCQECVGKKTTHFWCYKNYGKKKKTAYCVPKALVPNGCLGAQLLERCPTAADDENETTEDVKDCTACRAIKQSWCLKDVGNDKQVRACIPNTKVDSSCRGVGMRVPECCEELSSAEATATVGAEIKPTSVAGNEESVSKPCPKVEEESALAPKSKEESPSDSKSKEEITSDPDEKASQTNNAIIFCSLGFYFAVIVASIMLV